MKRVIVKRIFQGEIVHEFPEDGVFFEDKGAVIVVDPYGAIDVYPCKPVENEDVVLVESATEFLNEDTEFVINLILSAKA